MSPSSPSQELPVERAARLQQQTDSQRWLVRSVWGHLAVGWCSGHPKLGKTFLSIDLSVSVASGTDCLDTFPVEQPGPVLIYLAEDSLPQVRERVAALCSHRKLDIEKLDLFVITAPCLRLDDKIDQARLIATVSRIRPRLLVLDPLVRLHSSRENDSGDIAALLGFLRTLSREHQLAITVVHHMSKKNRRQLGQALRGSSDLWAWSDSAAYLTRSQGQVLLTLEHRSAPSPEPIPLVLALGPDGKTPHLERAHPVGQSQSPPPSAPIDRLRQILRAAERPLSRVALRAQLRLNNQRLGELLAALERDGAAARTPNGWIAQKSPLAPTTLL